MARSRVRPSTSNRVRIDQMCFGRSGGLAPISLPLFQGVRDGLFNRQASLSGMVVLLDLEAQRLVTAFREGLAQLGWSDGRDLRIDYRWAGGEVGRISAFAKELVELSPDIIVGYGTPVVVALQQETRSIPIVFLSVTDPVGQALSRALRIRAVT